MRGSIPLPMQRMTFDSFDAYEESPERTLTVAFATARTFAEDPDGWLVLLGGPGSGKTHLAVAIALVRIQRGEAAYYWTVPEAIDAMAKVKTRQSLESARLLVLDDFPEYMTGRSSENLYRLLSYRYNWQLPTVFVMSSMPVGGMDPVASRLNDVRFTTVCPLLAPDYRRPGEFYEHEAGLGGVAARTKGREATSRRARTTIVAPDDYRDAQQTLDDYEFARWLLEKDIGFPTQWAHCLDCARRITWGAFRCSEHAAAKQRERRGRGCGIRRTAGHGYYDEHSEAHWTFMPRISISWRTSHDHR